MSERHPGGGTVGPAPPPAAPTREPVAPSPSTATPRPDFVTLRAHHVLTGVRAWDTLPPFAAADVAGAGRSAADVAVLSAALGCPDLFLVGGEPDAPKLPFAADLAAEAVRAGERVLVLTAYSPDADDLLGRLVDRTDALVGRAVAADEHPTRLPAVAAERTARAYGDEWLAATRAHAAEDCIAAERAAAGLRAAAAVVEDVRAVAARLARITAEAADAESRPDVTAEALAAETDTPFAAVLRRQAAAHAAALARIDAESRAVTDALHTHRAEPPVPPKAGGLAGFLKGMFAARGPGAVAAPAEPPSVSEGQRFEAAVARLAAERVAAEKSAAAERDRCVAEECAGRRGERAALATQRAAAEAEFRVGCERLSSLSVTPPVTLEPSALDRFAVDVAGRMATADAAVVAAREASSAAAAHGPEWVRPQLARVRVVVGPAAAVGSDSFLTAGDGLFDRVVVVEADGLDDRELEAAVRLGGGCVLVGPVSSGRPTAFRRVWQPGHRPAWADDGGRVVVRLAVADPAAPLRAEPLADRPEIELRFGRGPGGDPVLAEVAFPPRLSAADAKAFLAAELGEVRLTPCGPVRWHAAADRLVACWPAAEAAGFGAWVDVAPGVREQVVDGGPGGWTAAVSFDPAAGWDRARAVDWLARHAAVPRTALLPRPAPVPEPTTPAPVLAGAAG